MAAARRGLRDTARPWGEIAAFYESLSSASPAFAPHADLARRIAKSPYADAGLCGLTSMHELIVGPSTQVLDNPHLIVAFDPAARRFTLTFHDGSLRPWSRTASPEDVFQAVERFLVRRARWFRPVGEAAARREWPTHESSIVELSGKGVVLAGLLPDRVDPVQEMGRLAAEVQRRGAAVVATVVPRRGVSRAAKAGGAAAAHAGRPLRPATYIGIGKARELQRACTRHDVDLVVFYNALDSAHQQALEDLTGVKVIDRFQLGLEDEKAR